MPAYSQSSTSPPPGFSETDVVFKHGQLKELLQKIIEKCEDDPSFLAQQSKETNLLISVAQLTLLTAPISVNDRRAFLNNIVAIGQDLLTEENSVETDSCPSSRENLVPSSTMSPSDLTMNDTEGDFSLDDLANEYLQNEPTPPTSSDKPTTSSESGELESTDDNLSKNSPSPSTPVTNVLSALLSPAPSAEPILSKPPLEYILFSMRLSSHDAADDADGIWKEESSPFGQMLCQKPIKVDSTVTKRISTCLLDRPLYEKLTRLVTLLPKQCVRNSPQQLNIRPNIQSQQPPRSNNNYPRQSNRPSFQQNSLQSYGAPRYPNSHSYSNSNFPNQQGNSNGYFVDHRSQQQQQQQLNRYYAQYSPDQQQQQQQQSNRYYAPYSPDQQYQQRNPPRNHSYNNGYQPHKRNQQAPNQYQQQRGTQKGSGGGGNKANNDKSNAPGSGPSVNPKQTSSGM